MKTNFENELPQSYREALHLDATDKKFGIVMNVISLIVIAVVMTITIILMNIGGEISIDFTSPEIIIAYLVFMASMIAYIILHELVHGAAYKLLTKEKLTFGIRWSCAFCGVPNIYVYRSAAMIAVAAPLVLFTAVFLPLTVFLYGINHFYCLLSAFLLGMHLGGCSGDAYVLYLLTFRYNSRKTLIKDTGPEQFIYVHED